MVMVPTMFRKRFAPMAGTAMPRASADASLVTALRPAYVPMPVHRNCAMGDTGLIESVDDYLPAMRTTSFLPHLARRTNLLVDLDCTTESAIACVAHSRRTTSMRV